MLIKRVIKNVYNETYLSERNAVWEEKVNQYKVKKIPLWNGSVYCLVKMMDNQIYIDLCEYKDIVFLEKLGRQQVRDIYGTELCFTYMNVQVMLRNRNGQFLFGTKDNGEKVELISVGGSLRMEDGDKIEKFEDIVQYTEKEISIETKIDTDLNALEFVDMFVDDGICTFLFEYQMGNLNKNILKRGEFDGGIILKPKDIFNKNKVFPNERLRSLRGYLQRYE